MTNKLELKISSPQTLPNYINKLGDIFNLEWSKAEETSKLDYRVYYIFTKHASTKYEKKFTLMLTKEAFSTESAATSFATGHYILNKIYEKLELFSNNNIPYIVILPNSEGWTLL